MTADNEIVNALWIGKSLSLIETLSIKSFLDQGHRFRLFTYESLDTPIPNGCEIMDANAIIPQEKIFRYKHRNAYGHGKGSVSGFSDIFRYKLLYEHGGWWVDMDVTCLKPLDFQEAYIFRAHPELPAVGNIMKCPPKTELMRLCYEKASQTVDENNTDWHKPIVILTDYIMQLGLSTFVKDGFSNPDRWEAVRDLLMKDKPLPYEWKCIHWMNENWRAKGLDKNDFMIRSTLGKLLIKHGLIKDEFSWLQSQKNKLRYRFMNWR